MELYNTFNKDNHLLPEFDKSTFETLHGWDFGYAILELIDIAKDQEHEIELSKRFSPGQKALYFIWYLDGQVTNGGFIQFYWNGKRRFIHPIIDGLKLIGNLDMLQLVEKADLEYLANKDIFNEEKQKGDWEPLYNNLKEFDEFDDLYYKIHDRTMELIENYIRKHPEEFVKLR